MRKALRWLVIVLGVLLLAVAGIWALSRALGPGAAQQGAVELLEPRPAPAGRNAFAAVWLLAYDVPESRLEAVTREDMQRWAQAPQAVPGPSWKPLEPASIAEQRYGRVVAKDRKRSDDCGSNDPDCLAKVRANLPAYRIWRQSEAKLLDRLQSLAQYDYLRNALPPRMEAPFPPLQYFGALPTLRALDFAEGRIDVALAGNCRDIAMMRRFAISSDFLIYTMVGTAYDRAGTRLLGEMLRELPADRALPAECAALAHPPKPEQLSLCNAMRGEFAFASAVGAQAMREEMRRSGLERVKQALLYDEAETRAEAAENLAGPCREDAMARLQQDQPPLPMTLAPMGLGDYFRCADNAIGCILARIAAPAYGDYAARLQDMGARGRLLGTLLWLREHADDRHPLAQRLAALPAELKSPAREIRIVAGGKALAVRMYDRKREKEFVLPLPTCLQDAVVTH